MKQAMSRLHRFYLVGMVCIFSLVLASPSVLSLGSDHPMMTVFSGGWPVGMNEMVNSPERIHGYFVNAADIFFFAGEQKKFEKALTRFSKIKGIEKLKIIIHEGVGMAKSPWDKGKGLPCDWMIYGCPASWQSLDPDAKGYIMEFHVWKGGKIKVNKETLPKGLIVEEAKKKAKSTPAPKP